MQEKYTLNKTKLNGNNNYQNKEYSYLNIGNKFNQNYTGLGGNLEHLVSIGAVCYDFDE